MKLSLVYKENTKAEIHAALISGKNPEIWLREINSWNIDPQKLTCFLLPQSLQSVEATGLFILFDKEIKSFIPEILNPYQKLSNNLFIPLHAQLYPPTLPEELAKITLWEFQVFHPQTGLVGFSIKDKVNFESLITMATESDQAWNYAEAGMTPFPY